MNSDFDCWEVEQNFDFMTYYFATFGDEKPPEMSMYKADAFVQITHSLVASYCKYIYIYIYVYI